MTSLVRTQIQLTREQARALRTLAAERGTSMASLIRDAVDGIVGEGSDLDAKWQRALNTPAYRDRSGATDASEEHDRYLDEAYGHWRS